MKKLIYILATLVAFASCTEKEDFSEKTTIRHNNYLLRVADEDRQLADDVIPTYIPESSTFYAENDYNAMRLLSNLDTRWELFRVKDTTKVSSSADPDGNGEGDGDNDTQLPKWYTINGRSVHLAFSQPGSGEPIEHFKQVYNSGLKFDPLCKVSTDVEYWSDDDSRAITSQYNLGMFASYDLNIGCGFFSSYCHFFFGGVRENIYSPYHCNNLSSSNAIPTLSNHTTITGLRLVSSNSSSVDGSITDPAGIKWTLVPSCSGGYDLNQKGGGDYLYLYYTTDVRTGRKITVTNPYLFIGTGISANTEHKTSTTLQLTLFSVLTNWIVGGDAWNVDVADWKTGIKEYIRSVESDGTRVANWNKYIDNNFDFIRCYDTDMKPLAEDGDHPANFNRNAKGDDQCFISYTYVDSNSPYWNKF